MTEIPQDVGAYNRALIERFRSGEMAGGSAERPLLLLTTTGRRSGKQRTTPLMYLVAGGLHYVIASNAGAPAHPDWYLNLENDPKVHVELGSTEFDALAVMPERIERQLIWETIVAQAPFFADHQAGIDRTIPLVALRPL